jgi:hypothetical protein
VLDDGHCNSMASARSIVAPAPPPAELTYDLSAADEPAGRRRRGPPASVIDAIYWAYPRHVKPEAARKAIVKALERLVRVNKTHDYLLERTRAFAASPAGQRGCMTPHPASWFNAGGYDTDPAQWQIEGDHGGNGRQVQETPAEKARRLNAEAKRLEQQEAKR